MRAHEYLEVPITIMQGNTIFTVLIDNLNNHKKTTSIAA
jgi:hypothetical protein